MTEKGFGRIIPGHAFSLRWQYLQNLPLHEMFTSGIDDFRRNIFVFFSLVF